MHAAHGGVASMFAVTPRSIAPRNHHPFPDLVKPESKDGMSQLRYKQVRSRS
jgi:hypothetical protein